MNQMWSFESDKLGHSAEALELKKRETDEEKAMLVFTQVEKNFTLTIENMLYCADGETFDYTFFKTFKNIIKESISRNYKLVENMQRPELLDKEITFAMKIYDALLKASERMPELKELNTPVSNQIFKAYDLTIKGFSMNDIYGDPNIEYRGVTKQTKDLYDNCYVVMNGFPQTASVAETEEFTQVITKAFEIARPLMLATVDLKTDGCYQM